MTQKLLTVVIPTYNMEKYLRRCLDSLLVSPEQMRLLEVLVVNDGSKDSSSQIAHEYEAKFPETFRVIDKENGNYGSCVNRGLDEAVGKYFRLLDADDRFDKESLAKFLGALGATDADMVVTNFCYTFDGDETRRKYVPRPQNVEYGKLYNASAFDFEKFGAVALLAMHGLTYKLEILREVGLRHQTGISYTDTEYVYFPLVGVRTILPLDMYLYLYTRGREGQTVSVNVVARSVESYYKVSRRIFDDYVACEANKKDFALRDKQFVMLSRIVRSYFCSVLAYTKRTETERERLEKYYKDLTSLTPELLPYLRSISKLKLHYFRIWERTGKYLTDRPYCFVYALLLKVKSIFKFGA